MRSAKSKGAFKRVLCVIINFLFTIIIPYKSYFKLSKEINSTCSLHMMRFGLPFKSWNKKGENILVRPGNNGRTRIP